MYDSVTIRLSFTPLLCFHPASKVLNNNSHDNNCQLLTQQIIKIKYRRSVI